MRSEPGESGVRDEQKSRMSGAERGSSGSGRKKIPRGGQEQVIWVNVRFSFLSQMGIYKAS